MQKLAKVSKSGRKLQGGKKTKKNKVTQETASKELGKHSESIRKVPERTWRVPEITGKISQKF